MDTGDGQTVTQVEATHHAQGKCQLEAVDWRLGDDEAVFVPRSSHPNINFFR